jgi:hypothetical protein
MSTDQKKPKVDENKEQEKQLKKLLESYTAVAAHKLGRPPSLEELNEMLNESGSTEPKDELEKTEGDPDSSEEPGEHDGVPNILKTLLFYGMSDKDGQRSPAPDKVLFYKHPDGRYYDCSSNSWSNEEPPMCAHLPSRTLGQGKMSDNERDIVSAIAHGVMDDEDYNTLNETGMISPSAQKVWELSKRALTLHDDLEKSLTEGGDEDEDMGSMDQEVEVDPDLLPGSGGEEGTNVFAGILEGVGISGTEDIDDFDEGDPGTNVAAQIMEAAKVAVGYVMQTEFEDRVRAIVQEEIQKIMDSSQDPEFDDEIEPLESSKSDFDPAMD